ncbi:serine O-acetyltransferase [Mesohalobacter halotolerans]|uniref:Serine acetyltransferase n=1 Tax=Mesohalobacter halotolerans TaxID=1883405 RepID=A0A4U5TU13_9FLAO|nr:DapH/DapD/GlmU-related protein [Mesohalobacter halotolerans]TKS56984.1 serine acetyltransferase [Mesohalobacter halotolerans]
MKPIILFRFSHFLFKHSIPFLPKIITIVIRFLYACYLPASLKAGKGLKLGYGGLGIVIHNRCIIGDNCHIDQNVTLGGTSKKYEVPVIGNNVYIGAGAKVIGPVIIGDNVVIGANAVVVKDIPSKSLVVGVPGRIIKTEIKMSDYA